MAERTEDLNLPISVITRIIKDSLPAGVLVSKEARVAISRATSVFVLHATTHANQSALLARRKTVTAQDVLEGVKELELDDFIDPLKTALESWKTTQAQKADAKKAKKNALETSQTEDGQSRPNHDDEGAEIVQRQEEEEEDQAMEDEMDQDQDEEQGSGESNDQPPGLPVEQNE